MCDFMYLLYSTHFTLKVGLFYRIEDILDGRGLVVTARGLGMHRQ